MSILSAILALITALPELLKLINRLGTRDIGQVLAAANKAIDILDGADTSEKKKNAAKALADFWADRD